MSQSNPLRKVNAPWTNSQVASLNMYQAYCSVHPYTSESGKDLSALNDGWEDENGRVVQTWAFEFTADWSWLPKEVPDYAPEEARSVLKQAFFLRDAFAKLARIDPRPKKQ